MRKRILQYIQYLLVVLAGLILRRFPQRMAVAFGALVGRLLYRVDKKHRELALKNIKLSFPEKEEEKLKVFIKTVFINIGRSFVEFLFNPKFTNKERLFNTVKVEGEDNLRAALRKGKGALVIVPHFGNWELGGMVYPHLFPCMAIAFPQSNPFTDKLIVKYRKLTGLRVIYTGDTIREILRTLKRNECVGLLADQDAAFDGVFVDLFGRKAGTKRGPAVLALKTGAPLLMTFMVREKDNLHHRMIIEKELEIKRTGDFEADVLVNTQRWAKMLEDYVRKYPDQWLWVHDRWKSRPEDFKK